MQGKPRPVVTWFKDGVPLEDKMVGTRTSERDTILFIRSAERSHSGKYTLCVQIETMLDNADIHIQIVGWSGSARRLLPFSPIKIRTLCGFTLPWVNNLFELSPNL